MESTIAANLRLLQRLSDLLLVVLREFSGDSPRALELRRKLQSRPNHPPSHADMHSEVFVLDNVLDRIASALPNLEIRDPGVIQAVGDLLEVLEQRFLTESEEERDDLGKDGPTSYPKAHLLLDLLVDDFWGPSSEAERHRWLCNHINLQFPRLDDRKSLMDAVERCHRSLSRQFQDAALDIPKSMLNRPPAFHDKAAELFSDAEKLHGLLRRCQGCACSKQLTDPKFAFHLSHSKSKGTLSCTACFATEQSPGHTLSWRSVLIEFEEKENMPEHPALPDTHRRPQDLATSCDYVRSIPLCNLLQASLEDGGVLVSGSSRLTLSAIADSTPEPIHASRWSGDGRTYCFTKMTPKHRFTLALMLSYAYLHLGGGPWWPYDEMDGVCFFTAVGDASPSTFQPFFTPSLHGEDFSRASCLECPRNDTMPSLPAFGKLLMELAVGRPITWTQLPQEMNEFADWPFAKETLSAVRVCLSSDTNETLNKGATIRNDQRLRSFFLREVVLNFQNILEVAFGLKPRHVFASPHSASVNGVERPSSGQVRYHGSAYQANTYGTLNAVSGPDVFLFDGVNERGALDANEVHSSGDWMKKFKACVDEALGNDLTRDRGQRGPVKVAVLDTGVRMSNKTIDCIFDGRLKERRSWLRTESDQGELLSGDGADEDGHGTHVTSILLEATQETDIEVYVGQVFRNGEKKTSDDDVTSMKWRVAKAIRYAVDHWDVDIISMSFGCAEVVPEINDEINYAYGKGKLMLAAASNGGGNDSVSWPAYSHHVMSVFATDGQGNKYIKNPNPEGDRRNFAVLGTLVNGLRLPDCSGRESYCHRSGTSFATPIAASIAAIVMSVLRRARANYFSNPERLERRTEQDYDEKLKALGRPAGMEAVFKMMSAERDKYDYVTIWTLFKHGWGMTELENILNKIRA